MTTQLWDAIEELQETADRIRRKNERKLGQCGTQDDEEVVLLEDLEEVEK